MLCTKFVSDKDVLVAGHSRNKKKMHDSLILSGL